ncbi:hypothetical protein AALO_G00163110 [Alosa alosa]|uniref:Rab11 family-interacting protein 1 n=1 Tax=Alosa alosa TaxID=278164 RepID=A0AAV6GBA7_9TELE|nr:rab11 family-interacting protein 1 [Alosa alosa]KAG5272235.1 hypothetical protein AALO_G00163110 [Alosa alosa]
MSLADQSQQWFPTSVQVTVLQAKNLRIKGKNGTNDAYAIMQVAKEKFSTSVAEKCVAPVWKEEATFDLPLFHQGNADRCTLHVHVMHRALVGPDKLLGQAVINLLDLEQNKTRDKTEWFKLLDKSGKADKDRGEVLLDVQFMKNNMTASMFDLSSQEKSRSRMGKLKDKLRGKKKEGLSDSMSAVVPSVTQVMTDSEGEEEGAGATSTPKKKKNKLKSLFVPKSNLHRNSSQSMSTLGPLPERDSALGSSRSSGLNVDSPEAGKKKFKFLTHKRTGSSDSKSSLGSFSGLGQPKQSGTLPSNLCVNGSHVYSEEPERKPSRASSTFSLSSSGHGSMEELRKSSAPSRSSMTTSVESLRASEAHLQAEEEEEEEEEERKRRMREEEERRRLEEEEEEQRLEKERVEQERRRMQEERERTEREAEEERKRRAKEEEERRFEMEEEERIRKEEEEERRLKEEERRKAEEERMRKEQERLEEERRRAEEERMRREQERLMEERKRAEEERMRREQERLMEEERRRAEEERMRREQERLMEEERRRAEEERMRREQERRSLEEEERIRKEEEEERERIEKEEERLRIEEDKRKDEERRRIEEEEKVRREEEKRREEERIEEERRREEEKIEEEERLIREERERIWREEEDKKELELQKKEDMDSEEDRGMAEEEEERRRDEQIKKEEERRMLEEEERIRRERERMEREEEEERQRIEEERVRREEERRLEEEKEMTRREEERQRIEREEERRAREEQEQQKEEERIRAEQEERMKREEMRMKEEERIRKEEERKKTEKEDRIRKEEEERRKREEEEERQNKLEEEQERKRREKEEEEAQRLKKLEKEEAEEKKRLERESRMKVEQDEFRHGEMESAVAPNVSSTHLLNEGLFTNPFEGPSISTNLFEDPSVSANPFGEAGSPHDQLSHSTNVSTVKPSSPSVGFSPQASHTSSNPFLTPDDPENAVGSVSGSVENLTGTWTPHGDRTEKKRRAPSPPMRKLARETAAAKQATPLPTSTLSSAGQPHQPVRERDGHRVPDPLSSRQDKRPAPQPPAHLRKAEKSQSLEDTRTGSAPPPRSETMASCHPAGSDDVPAPGSETMASCQPAGSDDVLVTPVPSLASQVFRNALQNYGLALKGKAERIKSSRSSRAEESAASKNSDGSDNKQRAASESSRAAVQPGHSTNPFLEPKVSKHNKGPAPKPRASPRKAEPQGGSALAVAERKHSEETHEETSSLDPHRNGSDSSEGRPVEEPKRPDVAEMFHVPSAKPEDDTHHVDNTGATAHAMATPGSAVEAEGHSTELDSQIKDDQKLPKLDALSYIECTDGPKRVSEKKTRAPLPPANTPKTQPPHSPGPDVTAPVEKTPPSQDANVPSDVKSADGVVLHVHSASSSFVAGSSDLPREAGGVSAPSVATPSSSPQRVRLHACVDALPLSMPNGVTGDSGKAGGSTLTSRRPHAVKPLSAQEPTPAPRMQPKQEQTPVGMAESARTRATTKVAPAEPKGPYSQLTQEELIGLVLRQQEQLAQRSAKILELEEYIDNLVLRVIEEKPSILMSLSAPKRGL